MDIMNYGLHEKYEQLKKFGDRLSDMKDIIDWDRIKPLLSDLYRNDTKKGGKHPPQHADNKETIQGVKDHIPSSKQYSMVVMSSLPLSHG